MHDIYIGDARIWQSLKLSRASFDTIRAIKRFSRNYELRRNIPVVGLEKLVIQRNLSVRGEKELPVCKVFDNIQFKDSGFYSYLLGRSESELAFLNLIKYQKPNRREWISIIRRMSESLSGSGDLRCHRGYTTKFLSGERIEFLFPGSIVPRIFYHLYNILYRGDMGPFEKAVACYLDLLTIHPLSDGNGRLARCMFMYSLYCDVILNVPILPIGPAIALNRSAILSGCLQWQLNLNAGPILETMTNIVKSTIEDVNAIFDNHM